jgi:excisionase family DNA binding protein
MYSIREVATICGVGISTIRDWVKKGQLEVIRIGPKLLRIKSEELTRFLTQ